AAAGRARVRRGRGGHRHRRRGLGEAAGPRGRSGRGQPAADEGHASGGPGPRRGAGQPPGRRGARGPMTSAPPRSSTALERAPGKLSLGLAVLTRRGDGFHELETLFARLGLADEVAATLLPDRPGVAELAVEAAPYAGAAGWFALSVEALPVGPEN